MLVTDRPGQRRTGKLRFDLWLTTDRKGNVDPLNPVHSHSARPRQDPGRLPRGCHGGHLREGETVSARGLNAGQTVVHCGRALDHGEYEVIDTLLSQGN